LFVLLPLLFLVIALSVLLFTATDFPFGIFKLFGHIHGEHDMKLDATSIKRTVKMIAITIKEKLE
jgi:hypothetical protein